MKKITRLKFAIYDFLINIRAQFMFFFDLKDFEEEDLYKFGVNESSSGANLISNLWNPRMTWGEYNTANPYQWYSPEEVKKVRGGAYELSVGSTPAMFNGTYIPRSVGLIESDFNVSYGLYSWSVELPKGADLWPAIWLTNDMDWPPEIDVLEGYTNGKGKYGSRLKTNVYYKKENNKGVGVGAVGHGLFVDKKDSILHLHLYWTKQSVSIYYNQVLVRKITDKEVISALNYHPWMKVVMNNAVRKDTYIREQKKAPFKINCFAYYKPIL